MVATSYGPPEMTQLTGNPYSSVTKHALDKVLQLVVDLELRVAELEEAQNRADRY